MGTKNIDNELKPTHFISYIELQRKKEMVRVTTENRLLLDRIRKTQPTYNHLQWEQDAEKRVEYLRTMTQFPDLFVPPGSKEPPPKNKKTQRSSSRRQLTDCIDDTVDIEDNSGNIPAPDPPAPPQDTFVGGTRPNRPFLPAIQNPSIPSP
jgi:hypothetical protein